ncbi:uncharacterized protein LOC132314770 [Cornus florida]|uniref:uncharacterized protein LOC132314770 n=1 Tax=Cornus florida TaxID=4283 RepID=UPI00289A120E|nr:uncharacterized protein LOC132314770 [Cornus florida]
MAQYQPPNKKAKNMSILSFYKKGGQMSGDYQSKKDIPSASNIDNDLDLQPHALPQVVEPKQLHSTSIEKDHGLRIQMHEYSVNQRDEVRRAYINLAPYQSKLSNYPSSWTGKQNRRFKYEWFKQFLWLEYSPSNDKAYCFPCFLFEERNKTGTRSALMLCSVGRKKEGWKENRREETKFLRSVGKRHEGKG